MLFQTANTKLFIIVTVILLGGMFCKTPMTPQDGKAIAQENFKDSLYGTWGRYEDKLMYLISFDSNNVFIYQPHGYVDSRLAYREQLLLNSGYATIFGNYQINDTTITINFEFLREGDTMSGSNNFRYSFVPVDTTNRLDRDLTLRSILRLNLACTDSIRYFGEDSLFKYYKMK